MGRPCRIVSHAPALRLLVLAFVLLLSACGGGGGGGGSDTTLTAISISPSDPSVQSGSTVQLTATGTYSDSSTADLTTEVTWTSLISSIATVDAAGLVSAIGVGNVTIAASHPTGVSGDTIVNVQGFTISGTIQAAAGSTVDGDVNDPNAPELSNDTPNTAQQIRNPSVVGGYASQSTDQSDFYRVSLLAGQQVVLTVADFGEVVPDPDLDLFLYLDDGDIDPDNPDFASVGTNAQEELTAPGAGTYVVEVFANGGASNYNLLIGQSVPLATGQGQLRMDHEFVPGELIVKLESDVTGALGNGGAWAQALGLGHRSGRAGEPMLMTLGDETSNANLLRSLSPNGQAVGRLDRMYGSDDVRRAKLRTLQAIKALRKRADVVYAEPNFIRRITAVPNDPGYPFQWHYPLINLPEAWVETTGDPDVIVAVIDSGILVDRDGILPSHPDFSGRIVEGYDFISDLSRSLDGDGLDPNPYDPGDQAYSDGSVTYSSFHGTHVAGTVAAATNNGTGVAGIAWQSRIMPLRVIGLGGFGTDAEVLEAMKFAVGLPNASGTGPAQPADVINLSLGGPAFSQTFCDAVSLARGEGAIVVAAAGNSLDPALKNALWYPASCPGAVSVSAVDANKELAYYSVFNSEVDVAAPGGDTRVDTDGDGYVDGVLSTGGDDSSGTIQLNYPFFQGTSMAAPHVAGVAALMEAASTTDLTPESFDSLLQTDQLTEDLGVAGKDVEYGYGLINAFKAVLAARGASPSDPLLTVTPSSVNLGTSGTGAEIVLANIGGGSPQVTAVTIEPASAALWLSVSSSSVDAAGLGTYLVEVDRSTVAEGTYTAAIVFATTAGSVNASVLMQKLSGAAADDAGPQYILVVDRSSGVSLAVAGTSASASGGLYAYTIPDVPFGDFQIYTGSNLDNDSTICDEGEACGAYLTLDEPVTLRVDSDLSGVDFGTAFQVSIPTTTGFGTTANPRLPLSLAKPKN
ncbi:MAG: S8 family serine peptidase [Chromatiales bacterium]|jgi:serine protease